MLIAHFSDIDCYSATHNDGHNKSEATKSVYIVVLHVTKSFVTTKNTNVNEAAHQIHNA